MNNWKKDGSDNAEIREFLSAPANIRNCAECPYARENATSGLPCGQQNCWVEITCEEEEGE